MHYQQWNSGALSHKVYIHCGSVSFFPGPARQFHIPENKDWLSSSKANASHTCGERLPVGSCWTGLTLRPHFSPQHRSTVASCMHRQETVDCLKKFNARRKLKVIHTWTGQLGCISIVVSTSPLLSEPLSIDGVGMGCRETDRTLWSSNECCDRVYP